MTAAEPEKLLHFNILETLGSGGNGTVYRAVNATNQKVVALKTLKNASEVTLNRFKREFHSLKRMDNAGIVNVYEGFFEHDPPFFSMEWVKGKTLSEVIEDMENNPMVFSVKDRENFAIRMAIQTCDILNYIHGFEEVHRDLKPDNIFITQEKGGILSKFHVKMLDFGLLKNVNEETERGRPKDDDTESGMIVGTVHYLSPEQAKGSLVDPRSDLYSLGVIIYKIISLKLPYEAKDVVGYIFKTVFEEPAPIEQHQPECSTKMQGLLKDLLAKEPGRRPPSSSALKRRLKSLLEPTTSAIADIQASDLEFDTGLEGFGSPLLPPPLIGREDAILEMVNQVELLGDSPRAIIMMGEPGMGRTSVIKEWKSRIRMKNPYFMTAHFSEELIPSQDPIGMLLDSLIRLMKPERVKAVFKEVYPFLADASRYLGRYFDTKSVGRFDHLSPSRKLQVLAVNFIKLIHNLEADGPVIIVLDDVQNAPERFYGWLTLFWEQLASSRLLLVFSCTPEPNPAQCTQFLNRLKNPKNHLDTVLLPLKALDLSQTTDLLQSMLPIGVELPFSGKLSKLLMERANGNPFYSTELFSRLYEDEHLFVNQGRLDIRNVDDVDVPLSIHQALLKKVERLPKDAHYLLKMASIFGNTVEYQVLVVCMQWPDEKFINNLVILLKLGILSEEDEPVHKLNFNAPALQKVLYNEIPPAGRRALHSNAASAIELNLRTDDVPALEQVAFHYANSLNYVRAVKYAYLAGNSALEAKETEKAIYFYQLTLDMMEKMENKQARNLVNLKLAEVHLDNHQPAQALEFYNKSLNIETLSKMEELRSLRGRMMCYQNMDQLDDALADSRKLCEIGASFTNRIKAETLAARGELSWLADGDAVGYRTDLLKAKALYPKLKHWPVTLPFTQILSNELAAARKHLGDLVKAKYEPGFPVYLMYAWLRYFAGDFKKAHDYLKMAKTNTSEVGATTDPKLMIAHALLTFKLQSTLSPDHSSDEYLAIARRYIERFGLRKEKIKITLIRLEHLLMTGQYKKAWELISKMAKRSSDLPVAHHDLYLFLSFAMRAAWEMQERPPRGWLLRFQKFKPGKNASFILHTHWALARAAEAQLRLSTSAPAALRNLKTVGELLIKMKLKYYYRAVLVKEIALVTKLGATEKAEALTKLKKQIDGSLGIEMPD